MSRRLSTFFRRNKKYDTPTDLQNMRPEEIIQIDPTEISRTIIHVSDYLTTLNSNQRKAVERLLLIKKYEKQTPSLINKRESQKARFLSEIGLNPEVERLIKNARQEVVKEQGENIYRKLKDDSEMAALQRRYNALNQPNKGGKKNSRRIMRIKAKGKKGKKTNKRLHKKRKSYTKRR